MCAYDLLLRVRDVIGMCVFVGCVVVVVVCVGCVVVVVVVVCCCCVCALSPNMTLLLIYTP